MENVKGQGRAGAAVRGECAVEMGKGGSLCEGVMRVRFFSGTSGFAGLRHGFGRVSKQCQRLKVCTFGVVVRASYVVLEDNCLLCYLVAPCRAVPS